MCENKVRVTCGLCLEAGRGGATKGGRHDSNIMHWRHITKAYVFILPPNSFLDGAVRSAGHGNG